MPNPRNGPLRQSAYNGNTHLRGEMCEWLKQAVLNTAVPERVPGVRIPLSPPYFCALFWQKRSFDSLRSLRISPAGLAAQMQSIWGPRLPASLTPQSGSSSNPSLSAILPVQSWLQVREITANRRPETESKTRDSDVLIRPII